jgi:sugar (pentulose or hexulose) kinase
MLAAMGGGATTDEVKAWVREASVTAPDEADFDKYDAVYGQFKALYHDLKNRFDAVAALQSHS